MSRILGLLASVRLLFLKIAETGLALVGVIALVYILLGEDSGSFVISVITNLSLLISALTPTALLALTLALIGIWAFRSKD
jgi:hypothetical protein